MRFGSSRFLFDFGNPRSPDPAHRALFPTAGLVLASEQVDSPLVAGEFVRQVGVELQQQVQESVADFAFGESSGWGGSVVEPGLLLILSVTFSFKRRGN